LFDALSHPFTSFTATQLPAGGPYVIQNVLTNWVLDVTSSDVGQGVLVIGFTRNSFPDTSNQLWTITSEDPVLGTPNEFLTALGDNICLAYPTSGLEDNSETITSNCDATGVPGFPNPSWVAEEYYPGSGFYTYVVLYSTPFIALTGHRVVSQFLTLSMFPTLPCYSLPPPHRLSRPLSLRP
jgi:hypothetical protein